MLRFRSLAHVCFALALSGVLSGCPAASPVGGPEVMCARACEAQAAHCTSGQCARGCNLVLDRLAEREGGSVVACVAASSRACDDRAWAHCAARIGPHADGGPPPPPPPNDVEDVGEGD